MSSATITALYRYPLKGFSAERLKSVHLKPGEEMPFDRAFAIENGPSGFDPEQPATLPKIRFLMLMRNENIARFESRFDPANGVLSVSGESGDCVSGSLYDSQGIKKIERWIAETFADDLRGSPRILRAEGHTFSDVDARVLHLVNVASVRALEEKIGRPVDPMRFRANIVIDGAPPFAELDWPGRQMAAGETLLTVTERTQRCAATNVDPSTGERDLKVPRSLMDLYGHSDFGVYVKVERGGRIAAGNSLSPVYSLTDELPFQ